MSPGSEMTNVGDGGSVGAGGIVTTEGDVGVEGEQAASRQNTADMIGRIIRMAEF
jgi:hypothetical protein